MLLTARVAAESVRAHAAVLARVRIALVEVGFAIRSDEARGARARVSVGSVITVAAVLARIAGAVIGNLTVRSG